MGFNVQLVQDEAAVFELVLLSDHEANEANGLAVSGLKSGGAILDKALIKTVMEGGAKKPRKLSEEVTVYREVGIIVDFVLLFFGRGWLG